MPYLNVKVCGQKRPEVTQRIFNSLTTYTSEILGKKTDLISISVEYIDHEQWAIAGKSLEESTHRTFFLEIRITDGTNTKNEKADFIEKIFSEFESILGPISPVSYIVVHDVRADAWGYGGETQEFRYIKGYMNKKAGKC